MKKLFSLFIIIALLASLTACHKEPEVVATPDKPVDYVEFREEAKKMTMEDAEAYLNKEDADKTTAQYKEAVYTVVEEEVTRQIEEALKEEEVTPELSAALEGVWFRFLEGEDFTSDMVRSDISKIGSFSADQDGWYRLSFFDRTLADALLTTDKSHVIKEYTNAVEILLRDPNVVVKTTLE